MNNALKYGLEYDAISTPVSDETPELYAERMQFMLTNREDYVKDCLNKEMISDVIYEHLNIMQEVLSNYCIDDDIDSQCIIAVIEHNMFNTLKLFNKAHLIHNYRVLNDELTYDCYEYTDLLTRDDISQRIIDAT